MSPSAPRLIEPPLVSAARTSPRFTKLPLARQHTAMQAAGRAFEKKVAQSLALLPGTIQYARNPWFVFEDQNGPGVCSPDDILWVDDYPPFVIEVKRTWVPEAAPKLQGLYVPIVLMALNVPCVLSLIVCKNLTSETPRDMLIDRLKQAIDFNAGVPVLQWLGEGDIPW